MSIRQSKVEQLQQVLQKYAPEELVQYLIPLFQNYPVSFKIVKPRKSKLGDFRVLKSGKYQITINGNLNPYSFVITTIHEFAHLKTQQEYGWKAKAHGEEWKRNYRYLLLPVIDSKLLPMDIQKALEHSLINTKASSCTDIQLFRTLRKYETSTSRETILEEIPKNSTFVLENRVFRKGNLRRTRYMCEEVTTGKLYLVNALANVNIHSNGE